MADTARPLGSLQALLADNSSKGISPQDVRDFLVSTLLKQVTTTAANYSATANDVGIIVDATTNAAVITLPTVSSQYTGHLYFIKAINAGTNKPYITSGSNINSISANWTLNSSNEYVTLLNTGSEYQVVGTNRYPKMVQTAPANLTITAGTVSNLCNQTVPISYGGVLDVYFQGNIELATTTALDMDEQINLLVDGATINAFYATQKSNTAIANKLNISIRGLKTLSAGTHSITVSRIGYSTYPLKATSMQLFYEINDQG